jgi:hypothetical protein
MASLEGTNEIVSTTDIRAGIRVEAYLNLCEHESIAAGRNVYHGVIELTDTRGGLNVPVTLLPVFNDTDGAHKGHFDLNDASKAVVQAQTQRVIDTLVKPDNDESVSDEQIVRAMWMTAGEQAAMERNTSMGGMMELLSMLQGGDDDDEDVDDNSPFAGSFANPFSGLLS